MSCVYCPEAKGNNSCSVCSGHSLGIVRSRQRLVGIQQDVNDDYYQRRTCPQPPPTTGQLSILGRFGLGSPPIKEGDSHHESQHQNEQQNSGSGPCTHYGVLLWESETRKEYKPSQGQVRPPFPYPAQTDTSVTTVTDGKKPQEIRRWWRNTSRLSSLTSMVMT